VSWRYLRWGLEIFDGCSVDICWVSWRYLLGVLNIFDWCFEDI